MNVHLHIDRLILEGLPAEASHGELIRAAVEAELARLLASGRLNLSSGAFARVPAPVVQVTSQSSSTELGQQVGRALYGAVSRVG
jgi:hypothetical protein